MWRDASLSRRLLIAAGFFIAVAMVIATVLIGFVLHRFVMGQIDQRLDTQIVFLSSMLRADKDGRISLAGNADGPPFDRPRHGWYWQVSGPAKTLRSASLDGDDIDVAALAERDKRPPPRPRDDREARPRPADGPGPDDEPLHFRIRQIVLSGAPLTIVVSAPRAAVWGPLREAMITLGISLAALGVALVVAMLLQIRLGLRPLERLRRAVAEVRRGDIERVPARQPQEIQPLVAELNGLLDENAANLERARRHVANLAHGLKTPLATLAIAASGSAHDPSKLQSLIGLMERRIRHHLGRARSAALSGPVRAQTLISPRLADLGEVMLKINAEKAVLFALDVAGDCAVACEQQDFDEMAGNLMENGFKWARGKVAVRAGRDDRMVELSFDDDGAGLPAAQRVQVLRPGERLDESAPGFGFGLSITSELAELYGGSLQLDASPLGGPRATLRLPAP